MLKKLNLMLKKSWNRKKKRRWKRIKKKAMRKAIRNIFIDFMFKYPNFPIYISLLSLGISLLVLYIKLLK